MDIPAEVLEDLAVAEEFADGADEYVQIAERMLEQRADELVEAQAAKARALEQLERAGRAQRLAHDKLASLRRSEGVVRTAGGYALARTP